MNKTGLVNEVHLILNKTGYRVTKREANHIVDAVLIGVVAGLEEDGEVRINEFGRLYVQKTKPRTYTTPQGNRVTVGERLRLKFKPYFEVFIDE